MKTLITILIVMLSTINLYASRQFTNFSAELKNSDVELTWSINYADHLGTFEIQRMDENGKFEPLESINSNEQLSYSYVDNSPIPGNNYYRIVLILDNNAYYSKIIIITCPPSEALSLYPNPSSGENLQIRLNGTNSDEATLRIYDKSGALVKDAMLKSEMNDSYVLNNLNLESGVYYLLVSTSKTSFQKKFIIKE